MFFVGEDFVLHGQEDACAVHEVDDGQAVFHGDFLGAQVFLSGDGEPGPGFDGGVVGHDDALPSADVAYAGDDASGGASAVFFVHLMACEGAEFEEGCVFVYEGVNAFAGRHFAFGVEFFDSFGATALPYFFELAFEACDAELEGIEVGVLVEFFFACHEGVFVRG